MRMTKLAAARMTRPLVTVVMMAALVGGCAGQMVYRSGALEGTVADAATGQPIAGAVVLALWYREIAIAPHGPARDLQESLEVLSDAKGQFTIPERAHFVLFGEVVGPEFDVYAPGYAPYPSAGVSPRGGEEFDAMLARGRFDVRLPKLATPEERRRYANITIGATMLSASRIPNMIRAVNREREALGLQPNTYSR